MRTEESRVDEEDALRHNNNHHHHRLTSPEEAEHPDRPQVHHSDDINDEPPPYDEGLGLSGASKTPPCGHHGRFYCSYKEDYPSKVVTEVRIRDQVMYAYVYSWGSSAA